MKDTPNEIQIHLIATFLEKRADAIGAREYSLNHARGYAIAANDLLMCIHPENRKCLELEPVEVPEVRLENS